MDLLERFPRAWCDTCETVRPIVLDIMKAKEKYDYDAADIVCQECKSILVTLHAPSAARSGVRTKKAAKASEMAAQEIDRLIDPSAPDEERQRRKRRLRTRPRQDALWLGTNPSAPGRALARLREAPAPEYI